MEWISVDERLPLEPVDANYFEVVEVIATDGNEVFACDFKCGNTHGDWAAFELDYSEVKVTHWMPMPEPPKDA